MFLLTLIALLTVIKVVILMLPSAIVGRKHYVGPAVRLLCVLPVSCSHNCDPQSDVCRGVIIPTPLVPCTHSVSMGGNGDFEK